MSFSKLANNTTKLRVLSLFSGIGGFDLGLERTGGFETIAMSEIDPYCRAVLKKHWPGVPIYGDIKELNADRLARDGIGGIDVICGGFPCQDLSLAGKGAGLAGARSGLWSEYFRLIREIRPRYVIVENVPGLLSRGMGDILGNLSSIGYDTEWNCVPASYVRAPHRRDRVWIVAYPAGTNAGSDRVLAEGEESIDRESPQFLFDSSRHGRVDAARSDHETVAEPGCELLEGRSGESAQGTTQWVAESTICGMADEFPQGLDGSPWLQEWEGVPRVAQGVENRVQRLMALGNSVVPQVVELIGRAIINHERK